MRKTWVLSLLGILMLATTVGAAPQGATPEQSGHHNPRIHQPDRPTGHPMPPNDIVMFGLSRRGDDAKPFIIVVPPPPPPEPSLDVASATQPGKAPKVREQKPARPEPMPPARPGFLGLDGQGYVLTKSQVSFMEGTEGPNKPPFVKTIKATVVDVAPMVIPPEEMEKKSETERQQIAREFDEKLKNAKEIGTVELNFTLRHDLKSPIMTDMEILTADGLAKITGEEHKLLFVAPPPPPRHTPRETEERPETHDE